MKSTTYLPDLLAKEKKLHSTHMNWQEYSLPAASYASKQFKGDILKLWFSCYEISVNFLLKCSEGVFFQFLKPDSA